MCAHDGIVEVSQKRIHRTYKLLNKQDDTCIAKYQHCVCVVLLSPAGDAAAADAVGRPAAADGRRRRTHGLMEVRQKPPATVATVAPAVAATLAAVAYTSNSGSSSASCLVESPLMSHTAAALRFGWPRQPTAVIFGVFFRVPAAAVGFGSTLGRWAHHCRPVLHVHGVQAWPAWFGGYVGFCMVTCFS